MKVFLYILLVLALLGGAWFVFFRKTTGATDSTSPANISDVISPGTIDFSKVQAVPSKVVNSSALIAQLASIMNASRTASADTQSQIWTNLINQNQDAGIPLPQGAVKGPVVNSFIFNGGLYVYDPKGTIPQYFTGLFSKSLSKNGIDIPGVFINTWQQRTVFPCSPLEYTDYTTGFIVNMSAIALNSSPSIGSFVNGKSCLWGEPLSIVYIDGIATSTTCLVWKRNKTTLQYPVVQATITGMANQKTAPNPTFNNVYVLQYVGAKATPPSSANITLNQKNSNQYGTAAQE